MKHPPFYVLKYTIKANPSPNGNGFAFNLFGDPDENRTRVTAVKGRCLNRLTTGPNKNRKKCGIKLSLVAAVGFEPTTYRV